jgi:hypothetical protein
MQGKQYKDELTKDYVLMTRQRFVIIMRSLA